MRNSLITPTKLISAVVARIGVTSGRMTRKKVWAWVAPSIFAASSSSRGIESKKPLISHTFPSAPPMSSRP